MKTLITAEQLGRPTPGGIATYVRGLARGLRQLDERPTFLVGRGDSATVERLAGNVYEGVLPTRYMTKAWDVGLGGVSGDYSVLHATSMSVPRFDGPCTVMIHDLAWRDFPDSFTRHGRRWHEAALQRSIARADVLFVPSTQTANALHDAGVDRRRIELVAHGHDHLPEPDNERLDEKLAASGVGDFILAVGTLEPRKNLSRLVDAYQRVRSRLPDGTALLVVGYSGWGPRLVSVPGVVVIDDATDSDLAGLYERCVATVYVPLVEGYGLPVAEAMSRGAAVIASAVPSAGDAALRVDPFNVPAIGEAIVRVATDGELRADLSRRGREHADGATWKAAARAHVEVWDRLT